MSIQVTYSPAKPTKFVQSNQLAHRSAGHHIPFPTPNKQIDRILAAERFSDAALPAHANNERFNHSACTPYHPAILIPFPSTHRRVSSRLKPISIEFGRGQGDQTKPTKRYGEIKRMQDAPVTKVDCYVQVYGHHGKKRAREEGRDEEGEDIEVDKNKKSEEAELPGKKRLGNIELQRSDVRN